MHVPVARSPASTVTLALGLLALVPFLLLLNTDSLIDGAGVGALSVTLAALWFTPALSAGAIVAGLISLHTLSRYPRGRMRTSAGLLCGLVALGLFAVAASAGAIPLPW